MPAKLSTVMEQLVNGPLVREVTPRRETAHLSEPGFGKK